MYRNFDCNQKIKLFIHIKQPIKAAYISIHGRVMHLIRQAVAGLGKFSSENRLELGVHM